MTAPTLDGVRLLEQTARALMVDSGSVGFADVLSAPCSGDYPNEWRGIDYRVVRDARTVGSVRLYAPDLGWAGLTALASTATGVEIGRIDYRVDYGNSAADIIAAGVRSLLALVATER